MYTIYEHVSPSGKRYIGQTCQPLRRRWRNGNGYVRNEYFHRAIQKYGWDAFEHRTICECETLEEANRVEAQLIEQYKTNDPKYGYNISGGADGSRRVSESTRLKMSAAKKGKFVGEENPNFGRKHTPDERARMSAFQKEYFRTHKSPRLGTHVSDESRKRMSESRRKSDAAKSAIQALNRSKSKRVLCVETGVIYPSAHAVERETGYRQGNVSTACRQSRRKAYGYHWEYV